MGRYKTIEVLLFKRPCGEKKLVVFGQLAGSKWDLHPVLNTVSHVGQRVLTVGNGKKPSTPK